MKKILNCQQGITYNARALRCALKGLESITWCQGGIAKPTVVRCNYELKKYFQTIKTILMQMSNEWNVGDMFTTSETGQTIFTVSKVLNNDVEAADSRSRAGVTSFTKSWVTKVWEVKKSQTDIEIAKYNTIEKIVEQLEMCKYECEGGFLNNNVAFIALKRMSEK